MNFKEKSFCLPENGPVQSAWENLLGELAANNAVDNDIAIEFECGACCKKVLNGERLFPIISLGIVVLLPRQGEFLDVKLFGEEGIIERQIARAIIIPIDRICSIEFGAQQVNGPCVQSE